MEEKVAPLVFAMVLYPHVAAYGRNQIMIWVRNYKVRFILRYSEVGDPFNLVD